MGAVEFVRDKATKEPLPTELNVGARVRNAALAHNLIVRAGGDTIVVCPPLIIQPKEIDQLVAALDAAIVEVSAELEAVETAARWSCLAQRFRPYGTTGSRSQRRGHGQRSPAGAESTQLAG